MAGNSQRKGAMRKPGAKKGASVGSGGRNRRALEGRGPTPKAEQRTGHPKARHAAAAERRSAAAGRGGPGGARPQSRAGGPGPASRSRKDAQEVVNGRNSVLEALEAGVPASTMWVASRIDMDDRVRGALALAANNGVSILEVPRPELDRITQSTLHQGVALAVPPYSYADPHDLVRIADDAGALALVVALDGVTDPRNLGAVVRSTAAFGGQGVIIPERRAAGVTASAWKASAGAVARIPVARAVNLTRALKGLQDDGLFVVGLDADGDLELPDLEAASGPLCIVIGSEGKGLSRLVRETCDIVVSIPMSGVTESLNAGVAAGVALYEVARRRSR